MPLIPSGSRRLVSRGPPLLVHAKGEAEPSDCRRHSRVARQQVVGASLRGALRGALPPSVAIRLTRAPAHKAGDTAHMKCPECRAGDDLVEVGALNGRRIWRCGNCGTAMGRGAFRARRVTGEVQNEVDVIHREGGVENHLAIIRQIAAKETPDLPGAEETWLREYRAIYGWWSPPREAQERSRAGADRARGFHHAEPEPAESAGPEGVSTRTIQSVILLCPWCGERSHCSRDAFMQLRCPSCGKPIDPAGHRADGRKLHEEQAPPTLVAGSDGSLTRDQARVGLRVLDRGVNWKGTITEVRDLPDGQGFDVNVRWESDSEGRTLPGTGWWTSSHALVQAPP
jgi:ribosomal protein L37AE/L43A/predicted RNA-binding Zn-ribbon protein involved in translation (DUF1610 family)